MNDLLNPAPEPVGELETVLLLGTEGGSLSLKRACHHVAPDRIGEPENAERRVELFWIEKNERMLQGLCPEVDLPGLLSTRSETRDCFTDAMKDLLDSHPWWLLLPRHVHPAWVDRFQAALDQRFPGWVEDPERYSDAWDTVQAWRRALQSNPLGMDSRNPAGTHKRARHPRKESS